MPKCEKEIVLMKMLQNQLAVLAERLTGTEVTVCDHLELNCYKCGVTTYVNRGEVATVTCEAGALGSIVKLVTPNNYLQVCELEIFGTNQAAGEKKFLLFS